MQSITRTLTTRQHRETVSLHLLTFCRLSLQTSARKPHLPTVTFAHASTAILELSANQKPAAIFKPAMPPTNRATNRRTLGPTAQPRPSRRFALHHISSANYSQPSYRRKTHSNTVRQRAATNIALSVIWSLDLIPWLQNDQSHHQAPFSVRFLL